MRLAELERSLEVGYPLVYVIAPDRELRGAAQPPDRGLAAGVDPRSVIR